MPKHPSSGQYAIVGLGVVAGQQPDRSERMLASEAARLAIEDAGLTPKDIDGAIDLRRTGGGGDRASYVDAYSRMLGLNNCFYFVVGRGGALAGLGIATALSFLDRGIANYICIMGRRDRLVAGAGIAQAGPSRHGACRESRLLGQGARRPAGSEPS